MSDSGESIRPTQDGDRDWALRLRRISDERQAGFDLSLSLGELGPAGEIRDAMIDSIRFDTGDINPYADEIVPDLPDLATTQRLLSERDAAVMAGDPEAVAQELSFGLTQHILDITHGTQPQPPMN